jgi:hypothetical protein
MAIAKPRIEEWGKESSDGRYRMPVCCPFCKSRKTVLVRYENTPTVECESCFNVIHEYPEESCPS